LGRCWAKNYVAEPNPHVLTFLHPILMCRGHILTAGGIALRRTPSLTQREGKEKKRKSFLENVPGGRRKGWFFGT
jgi:hypothetical protein